MSVRRSRFSAVVLVLGGLAGCSGGGGTAGAGSFDCGSSEPTVICVQQCTLGCNDNGCSRTDIAQNEIVIIDFSEPIDPASVNESSILFRTGSGEPPVGEFLVNGSTVEFVPTLSVTSGQTFYGFTPGETYTLTLPSGNNQQNVVRSTSGKPLGKTMACTLRSSLGIVDYNGVPPAATLVTPTPAQLNGAPRSTGIELEFNEMIDSTPFSAGGLTPVLFTVRRNREAIGGGYECDPTSVPEVLTGTSLLSFDAARNISTLSFFPTQILPGNICVEINVTNGVTDLSGKPAQPQTFAFRTEVVPLVEENITEEFDNADQLDTEASAGQWGSGVASFARIGGDGRHGDLAGVLASISNPPVIAGKTIYTLNTANTNIPGNNGYAENAVAVTDGRYYFTTMVVPNNVVIRFECTANPPIPPIVTVSGRLDIQGSVDVSGGSNGWPVVVPAFGAAPGQDGQLGGIFGGRGGKGGNKNTAGAGAGAGTLEQGVNGEPGRMLTGHPYSSSTANTFGRGSTVFPTSGLNTHLYFGSPTTGNYCVSASAGGGGGASAGAGDAGEVVTNNHSDTAPVNAPVAAATATTISIAGTPWVLNRYTGRTVTISGGAANGLQATVLHNTNNTATISPAWTTIPDTTSTFSIPTAGPPLPAGIGPQAAGGLPVQLFPFPAAGTPVITRASEHFLVGGAGGGGGASTAVFATYIPNSIFWAQGCGGGGGGGVVALRAGDSLRVAPTGSVLAKGGSGPSITGYVGGATTSKSTPAGGGGGGSVVLQTGRIFEIGGVVDVRGGTGGAFIDAYTPTNLGLPPQGIRATIRGGDGGDGFVRLEAPTAPNHSAALVTMQPAATANNVGALAESDDAVATRSKFYSTGLVFGPEYARYEIYATVDGNPIVLSDDPAISTITATPGSPVRAMFQCARLDLSNGSVLTIRPWRQGVRATSGQTGISSDGLNGFRFALFADYTLGTNITIDRVVVVYRV